MNLDSAIARPRSRSNHDLSCIGPIVFPVGETLSSPQGEFLFYPSDIPISPMETVEETRRNRLRMLVKKFGSMASLCEKLGYARNETAGLTRILNANVRHDRDGKPYNMGSPMAREIEEKLTLATGWMDTPPTYAELSGEHDPLVQSMQAMEKLPPLFQSIAAKIINSLEKMTSPTAPDPNDNSTLAAFERLLDAKYDEQLKKAKLLIQEHKDTVNQIPSSKTTVQMPAEPRRRKDDNLGTIQA